MEIDDNEYKTSDSESKIENEQASLQLIKSMAYHDLE